MPFLTTLSRFGGSLLGDRQPAERKKQPYRPALEALEDRQLLSAAVYQAPIQLTANQQYMLELINEMRTQPEAHLQRLLGTGKHKIDPNVEFALEYFKVDVNLLKQQWKTLKPVAPLAWDADLAAGAQKWAKYMYDKDMKSAHADPVVKEEAPYVKPGAVWENAYSSADSVFHAHAAFSIDWGEDQDGSVGGMQQNLGHRNNLTNAWERLIGIGIVYGKKKENAGPFSVTQRGADSQHTFITGVGYYENFGTVNWFYDPGEGIKGVGVSARNMKTGDVYWTHTGPSGGFNLQVPSGEYHVSYNASGIWPRRILVGGTFVTVGNHNVKFDIRLGAVPSIVDDLKNAAPSSPGQQFGHFSQYSPWRYSPWGPQRYSGLAYRPYRFAVFPNYDRPAFRLPYQPYRDVTWAPTGTQATRDLPYRATYTRQLSVRRAIYDLPTYASLADRVAVARLNHQLSWNSLSARLFSSGGL